MDLYEIRRQRLLKLVETHCQGKIAECARRLGRNQSYVGRLLYPAGKPGKRNISDRMIEAIEQAFQLPHGWLDGISQDPYLDTITKIWPSLSEFRKICVMGLIQAIVSSRLPDPCDTEFKEDGKDNVRPGPDPAVGDSCQPVIYKQDLRPLDSSMTPLIKIDRDNRVLFICAVPADSQVMHEQAHARRRITDYAGHTGKVMAVF